MDFGEETYTSGYGYPSEEEETYDYPDEEETYGYTDDFSGDEPTQPLWYGTQIHEGEDPSTFGRIGIGPVEGRIGKIKGIRVSKFEFAREKIMAITINSSPPENIQKRVQERLYALLENQLVLYNSEILASALLYLAYYGNYGLNKKNLKDYTEKKDPYNINVLDLIRYIKKLSEKQ